MVGVYIYIYRMFIYTQVTSNWHLSMHTRSADVFTFFMCMYTGAFSLISRDGKMSAATIIYPIYIYIFILIDINETIRDGRVESIILLPIPRGSRFLLWWVLLWEAWLISDKRVCVCVFTHGSLRRVDSTENLFRRNSRLDRKLANSRLSRSGDGSLGTQPVTQANQYRSFEGGVCQSFSTFQPSST